MEQNFQTSFIPKKPIIKERDTSSRPVSLLLIISLLLLFTVLLASGGLYFYKGIAAKRIAKMENDLTLAQNRFEPSKISELQVLDKRLRASSEILANHISITPIFELLEKTTMKTVGFTRFTYTLEDDQDSVVSVQMSGVAVGYRSIALQSDIFAQNKNMIDPIFSNLTLDNDGNVVFDLDFSVDSNFVNYKQTISADI
ncbi:MAG: hypothetical protein WAV15_01580 [Minisyncoccia bacterium]